MTDARYNVSRHAFICRSLAAAGVLLIPPAVCAADGDWKAAFRSLGFDPDAPGSQWFAVTADIHAVKWHGELAAHVAEWNAMSPAPAFVAALGDLACINRHFGDRVSPKQAAENARVQFGAVNEILTEGLRKDIRRVYVVGNHDTYIGEDDRALWRRHFPDQPPYCAFDACGMRFIKWDGGNDGSIGEEQEKWIREECARCPHGKHLVVLVHQPSVGECCRERDIGRVAKAALAGRPGVTWMLAGHKHCNASALWDLPGGGKLAVATHTMDEKGWWAYGVRDGRIIARIFKKTGRESFSSEKMPDAFPAKGEIPLAWEGRSDVVWKVFVGAPEEKACRISFEKPYTDNGAWLYYVGGIVYRFPKGKVAPSAGRFALLGELPGHRKTKEKAKCFFSSDGTNWIETKYVPAAGDIYEFRLPPQLAGADELWMKYDGFGMGGDECIGGFAFLP